MRSPGLARPTSSSEFEIHQQIKARKKTRPRKNPPAPVFTAEQEATLQSARASLREHLSIFQGLTEGEVGYEDAFMAVEGWLDAISNLVVGNTAKEK